MAVLYCEALNSPRKAITLAETLIGKVVGVLAPDRHSRDELSRRIYVRNRPAHMPPTDYTRGPEPGYIEPAGSAKYHKRTGRRRRATR